MNSLSDILEDYDVPLAPAENAVPAAEDAGNTARTEVQTDEVVRMVYELREQCGKLLDYLQAAAPLLPRSAQSRREPLRKDGAGHIKEGVFNGLAFVDEHGNEYAVPPNYASKSKLVEGDIMKLTFGRDGALIYKQIGPVPRRRVRGILAFDPSANQWSVFGDGHTYKVLTASATFYKAREGDEAVVLIPLEGNALWGAVEHIIPA